MSSPSTRSTAPLRVGSVPFLVGRPLDWGLEHEPGIEYSRDVPARLVEGLRSGQLDVAMVSSIELFRRPGYRYLDGLAVAGHAGVSSVQLFLRTPVEDVRRLALDPASRAGRTLVRVLFAERGLSPEWIEVAPEDDPRAADADAWLRIGDEALRETHADDCPEVFNPSAAWRELTGLPFMFATWIVAPGVEIEPFVSAFVAARARGAERAPALAHEVATACSIPLTSAREYLLEQCFYEPGAAMRPSLLEFQKRSAALDLCPRDLTPEPIAVEGLRVS